MKLARAQARAAAIGLSLVLAVALLRAWDPLPVQRLRGIAFDLLMRVAPAVPADPRVVIVAIDEASLARVGQWPWPRRVMASLMDRLADGDVRVVGLDMLFAEPDRLSADALLAALPNVDPATEAVLRRLPDGDALFAASLARVPAVLAVAGQGGATADGLREAASAHVFGPTDPLAEGAVTRYGGWVGSLPALHARAAGIGIVALPGDFDGRVRAVPAVATADGPLLPSLAVAMVQVAQGARIAVEASALGVGAVRLGPRRVATDREGRLMVRFRPHEPARFVAAADLLDGAVEPSRLDGAWVLVGATAAGLGDVRVTGLGDRLHGVEIHAQILDALAAGLVLNRPAGMAIAELALVAALAVALFWPAARLRPEAIALSALVAALAVCGGAVVAARLAGLLVDPTMPAGAAVGFGAIGAARATIAARARSEATLRALERELDQASRAAGIEQFASAVRHEIGQPLTSIAGFVEAARRLLTTSNGATPPKVLQHLDAAADQTRRVADIVRGLQATFARQPIEPRFEDINGLVGEALAIVALDGAPGTPRIVTRFAPDLPRVALDRVPIQQVIVNLGRNAIEAMAGRADATLTVTTRWAETGAVGIDLSDNGLGLDPSVAADPFAMFASSKGAGRGVGLAVSRSIVEDHGGRLTATANPAGGMTFSVILNAELDRP